MKRLRIGRCTMFFGGVIIPDLMTPTQRKISLFAIPKIVYTVAHSNKGKGQISKRTCLPAAHFTLKGGQQMEEFRKPSFSIDKLGFFIVNVSTGDL